MDTYNFTNQSKTMAFFILFIKVSFDNLCYCKSKTVFNNIDMQSKVK